MSSSSSSSSGKKGLGCLTPGHNSPPTNNATPPSAARDGVHEDSAPGITGAPLLSSISLDTNSINERLARRISARTDEPHIPRATVIRSVSGDRRNFGSIPDFKSPPAHDDTIDIGPVPPRLAASHSSIPTNVVNQLTSRRANDVQNRLTSSSTSLNSNSPEASAERPSNSLSASGGLEFYRRVSHAHEERKRSGISFTPSRATEEKKAVDSGPRSDVHQENELKMSLSETPELHNTRSSVDLGSIEVEMSRDEAFEQKRFRLPAQTHDKGSATFPATKRSFRSHRRRRSRQHRHRSRTRSSTHLLAPVFESIGERKRSATLPARSSLSLDTFSSRSRSTRTPRRREMKTPKHSRTSRSRGKNDARRMGTLSTQSVSFSRSQSSSSSHEGMSAIYPEKEADPSNTLLERLREQLVKPRTRKRHQTPGQKARSALIDIFQSSGAHIVFQALLWFL